VPQVTIGTMSAAVERDLGVELGIGRPECSVFQCITRVFEGRRLWARAACQRHI